MSRRRRVLSMLTASAAVFALGFVVAVAARSLPGGSEGEPVFDFEFRPDLDLGPVIAWILVVLAVLGVVLFALGLRQSDTRELGRRRSILGIVVGLLLFVVIVRWLRPAAEALLDEGAAAADSATEVLGDDRVGVAGGWLFSVLLAAILAAALTRIGLSVRAVPPDFSPGVDEVVGAVPTADPGPDGPRALGDDPRSRILAAYEDFEDRLAAVGRPRAGAETTARHAWRAGLELGLDPDEVRQLVGQHSRARFGITPPTESDAGAAERSAARLHAGIGI
ncbi:MAG TPA: DUF4129 domain-containing protein [Acidimicrobiia bacterium]|nr:DUF4129 domain-containing protein [Acidimicrobiia bacterium]